MTHMVCTMCAKTKFYVMKKGIKRKRHRPSSGSWHNYAAAKSHHINFKS